jgi:hypothetical protein
MSWACAITWTSHVLPSTPRPCERQKGALMGPSPTDRAKAGSKHHRLVEAHGLPLNESVTAANVHDTDELFPLVDFVPAVRIPSGQRHLRPGKLQADKAYAPKKNRRGLRVRGIFARIARPGVESKERLGRYRWVVERTLAWKNHLRRLRVRDERRDDVHFCFLVLGCRIMVLRHLHSDISRRLLQPDGDTRSHTQAVTHPADSARRVSNAHSPRPHTNMNDRCTLGWNGR